MLCRWRQCVIQFLLSAQREPRLGSSRACRHYPGVAAGRRRYHAESGGLTTSLVFHSSAFGLPKRREPRVPVPNTAKKHGLLHQFADFLFDGGPRAPRAPASEDAYKLPQPLAYLHGKGLQSTIRYHGRIVKTRLQSEQIGEDAYFLKDDALGIADGVGGWASSPHGDPALFSRLLMHFCYAEFVKYDELFREGQARGVDDPLAEWASCDPVEILQTAWERCVRASKREGIMGSSTALLALLRGDELRIANMGDCALMLIRDGDLVFRSTEQQHSFNYPVQLGMMDATVESVTLASALCMHRDGMIPDGATDGELPDVQGRLSDYIHSYDEHPDSYDNPRHDAGSWTIKVQCGDLVVMGSDGLFDNLYDEDIMNTVRDVREDMGDAPDVDVAHTLSESLSRMAKAASEDPRVLSSPFQEHANDEGIYHVGGKNDDVTVVAGFVAAPDGLARSVAA